MVTVQRKEKKNLMESVINLILPDKWAIQDFFQTKDVKGKEWSQQSLKKSLRTTWTQQRTIKCSSTINCAANNVLQSEHINLKPCCVCLNL